MLQLSLQAGPHRGATQGTERTAAESNYAGSIGSAKFHMSVVLASNGSSKCFGSTLGLGDVSLQLVGREVVALIGRSIPPGGQRSRREDALVVNHPHPNVLNQA
jgi:hypothetical protein